MSQDLRRPRQRPFRNAEAWTQHLERTLGRYCFLQDDQSVANAPGATVRADINNNLQALVTLSSGAASPGTTWAYQLWADTTSGLLKQRNAANAGWLVRGTLAETFVLARSSNTILAAADFGRTFNCTSSFTQTLTAAATLADGWWCEMRNSGTGIITLDPNGAETIDGATTIVLYPGEGCIVNCNGAGFVTVGRQSSDLSLARMHVSGLTYGNGDGAGGGDQTNDITIQIGEARDSTNAADLRLTAAITKQLDAAWAVGTAAGGLDTGAIGNSDYYLWLIRRSDTGVVDALFSLSSTAPTMPASYDTKRLIGWFKRVGAAIVLFHTYETEGGGLELSWDVPTLDVNLANTLTTARRTDAVKVPLNFSVLAHLNILINDAAGSNANWVYNPDQTDAAPSVTAAPLSNFISSQAADYACHDPWIRTSATGTVAARSTLATVDLYAISTMGFRWARRN